MHVEIQSYIQICMSQWYKSPYANVMEADFYCSRTNTRGDTVYTVLCMYLWYSGPYANVMEAQSYCSSNNTRRDTVSSLVFM